MKKTLVVLFSLLLFSALLLALAGCGTSGGTAGSQPENMGDVVNNAKQQADSAARESNLRLIDSAVQQYNAQYGTWPTDISQLAPYFARGVPTDPAGGTYYLTNENGEVNAAVR